MTVGAPESPELRRLRRRIDALDRRIVRLINDRARLGLAVGAAKLSAGRRSVVDAGREREVLLRVAMSNQGPLPQSELLAVYRRLILATRRLEVAERRRAIETPGPGEAPEPDETPGPGEAPGPDEAPGPVAALGPVEAPGSGEAPGTKQPPRPTG